MRGAGGHCSPPWGAASGRDGEGNLINSFHIQHFPHSIIFKLNNLSLGEKGKVPARLCPASLTKPTLWGPDGEGASLSPPLNASLYTHTQRQPLRPPCPETLARSHVAPVGLCGPGNPGGASGSAGWSGRDAREHRGAEGRHGGLRGAGVGVLGAPCDAYRTETWKSMRPAISPSGLKTQVLSLTGGRP